MLTLEKFERASELVKEVTTPTKLVFSEYLSTQTYYCYADSYTSYQSQPHKELRR